MESPTSNPPLPPARSLTPDQPSPAKTMTATKNIPTSSPIRPSASPTPTSTPKPTEPVLPAGTPMQVISPQGNSRLISPIPIELLIDATTGQVLRLELYSQDGRLRTRQLLQTASLQHEVSVYKSWLDFEIPTTEESARLVFHLVDEFSRPVCIESVDVTLSSKGLADVIRSTKPQPAIVFLEPQAGAVSENKAAEGTSDSSLSVSGISRLDANKLIKLQLITQEGRIIGQRVTGVTEPFSSGYGSFSAQVPYQVSEPTPVRLIAYQDGDPFSEISFLTSILITLQP